MRPDVALYRAMDGQDIERVLFVPKIWVDLAAALVGVDLVDIIGDPLLAMRVLVDAGLLVGADAVRQFIFPPRQVERDGEAVFEIDGQGRRIGEIDMAGGLATHLYDPEHFRLEDPFFIAHQTCWKTEEPLVQNLEDVRRIAVPDKGYYEATGYGDRLRAMLAYAGDRIALIGDCDSATLAFYAGFRGVQQAMLDFYMDPQLLHAVMDKGVERSIERGKFNIDVGLRVLRLNDSMATMSLISPQHWQEFIFPHMKTVCDELHHYCPDVRIYCHICGNVLPIIHLLEEVGLDCIAPLDPLGNFTVAQARAKVGDQMVLMGGINTISFIQSDAATIAAEAQRCIDEGVVGGGHFILGSGCALPRASTLENLIAVTNVARQQ